LDRTSTRLRIGNCAAFSAPVDLAEDSLPVLHYALSLAEESHAELIVLDAIQLVPWQYRASEDQRSRRALESVIPEQTNDWCKPEMVVRWEHAAEAILCEAKSREADLIVMNVHNRAWLHGWRICRGRWRQKW